MLILKNFFLNVIGNITGNVSKVLRAMNTLGTLCSKLFCIHNITGHLMKYFLMNAICIAIICNSLDNLLTIIIYSQYSNSIYLTLS